MTTSWVMSATRSLAQQIVAPWSRAQLRFPRPTPALELDRDTIRSTVRLSQADHEIFRRMMRGSRSAIPAQRCPFIGPALALIVIVLWSAPEVLAGGACLQSLVLLLQRATGQQLTLRVSPSSPNDPINFSRETHYMVGGIRSTIDEDVGNIYHCASASQG